MPYDRQVIRSGVQRPPLVIDLNADAGETGPGCPMGDDDALLPHVTSANIACGGHAGDEASMARTVALAVRFGVAVGAHPSYPDREGFGRREIAIAPDDLRASLLGQVRALATVTARAGVAIRHLKPHGALYHRAAGDPAIAAIVAEVARATGPTVAVVGPPGSALLAAALAIGLPAVAEAFADRAYEPDGTLRARHHPDALLADPAAAAAQALGIATAGSVLTRDGRTIPVAARTLCVHGDTPGAPAIAAAVRAALEAAGIAVAPMAGAA